MALGPDEAEPNHKKINFAGAPRMPRTLKNRAFEAFGGKVGHEHVIAAHLDGEGTAFSGPSEPKSDKVGPKRAQELRSL